MDMGSWLAFSRKPPSRDATDELRTYATLLRQRAQSRAAKESALKEAKRKATAQRERDDQLAKKARQALAPKQEKKDEGEQQMQEGERGGRFYVNAAGNKVYVK